MGWTLFFMLVVLKIPLAAALYIIWYAIKAEPVPDDGESDTERGPKRKPPPHPRPPRRGPAGGGACHSSPCPQVRRKPLVRAASGLQRDRS